MFFTIFVFFNGNSLILNKELRRQKNAVIFSLILIYFLTNSHLIFGQFNEYYDHFKTLTYGILYLIIVLGFCRPNKSNANLNQLAPDFKESNSFKVR